MNLSLQTTCGSNSATVLVFQTTHLSFSRHKFRKKSCCCKTSRKFFTKLKFFSISPNTLAATFTTFSCFNSGFCASTKRHRSLSHQKLSQCLCFWCSCRFRTQYMLSKPQPLIHTARVMRHVTRNMSTPKCCFSCCCCCFCCCCCDQLVQMYLLLA